MRQIRQLFKVVESIVLTKGFLTQHPCTLKDFYR